MFYVYVHCMYTYLLFCTACMWIYVHYVCVYTNALCYTCACNNTDTTLRGGHSMHVRVKYATRSGSIAVLYSGPMTPPTDICIHLYLCNTGLLYYTSMHQNFNFIGSLLFCITQACIRTSNFIGSLLYFVYFLRHLWIMAWAVEIM